MMEAAPKLLIGVLIRQREREREREHAVEDHRQFGSDSIRQEGIAKNKETYIPSIIHAFRTVWGTDSIDLMYVIKRGRNIIVGSAKAAI